MQANRKKNFRFSPYISKSVCQRSFALIRVGRNYYLFLVFLFI